MTTQPALTISSASDGALTIFTLTGVFDASGSVALEQQLAPLLAGAGTPRVIVDLAAVRYIASAGVGTLVSANRRCAARGGLIVLARPSESLREIFTTLNLHAILAICDGLQAAKLRAAG
jgi:anti-sigma B factor antagonist